MFLEILKFVEEYLYFFGSLFGLLLLLLIFLRRKDLRSEIFFIGSFVAIFGVISEYFFFKDYWLPPLFIQFGPFGGVEDLIFGFAAGGLGAVLYSFIFRKNRRLKIKDEMRWFPFIAIFIQIICLMVLPDLLSINSIFASSLGLIFAAVLLLIIRPGLIKNSIYSALLIGLLLIIIEGLFLFVFGKNYLEEFYLLNNTHIVLFGIFPITELIWGLSFGLLIGPMYEAINGLK